MATAVTQEEEYHSSSDSDFNEDLSASSAEEQSSEEEGATQKSKRKPKKRNINTTEDVGMGSGDEGIIAQGRKKRRKKAKGKKGAAPAEDVDDESEDEAAGIRVRLRSGRGGEEKVKKAATTSATATADIDSLWTRMNAPPSILDPPPPQSLSIDKENEDPKIISPFKAAPAPTQEESITIPHTYSFAGQSHTTQRTVPISSPEAQAYLSSLQKPKNSRPLARKNLLEPNPTRLINGVPSSIRTDLPPSIGGSLPKGKGLDKKIKDPKINTVEKSKMDWEAEVERTGIREELAQAGKSSKDYLGRKEFLDRVDAGRDERERVERLKGQG